MNTPCQSKRPVAEGFSCRDQIGQGTARRAHHPAEIRRAIEADA